MQKILFLAILVILCSCKKTIVEKIDADSFRVSILPVKIEAFNAYKVTGTLDIRNTSGEIEYGLLLGKSLNPTFENAIKYSIGKTITSVDFNQQIAGLDTGAVYYARAYAVRDNLIEYSANQPINKISPRIVLPEATLSFGRPFVLNINVGKLNAATTKVFLNETEIEIKSLNTSADASSILVEVSKQLPPGLYTLKLAIGELNVIYNKQLALLEGTWQQLDDLPADIGGQIGVVDCFMKGNWIYIYRLTSFGVYDQAQFYKYNYQTKEKVTLMPYENTFRFESPAILKQGSLVHFIAGSRIGLNTTKSHYVYDINTNTWTREADFAGETRTDAVSILSGNKIFVGLGYIPFSWGSMLNVFYRDMWSYDLSAKVWQKVSDFPLTEGRVSSATFTIGSKLYIVAGAAAELSSQRSPVPTKQTWCYDTATDRWSRKADYPGKGEVLFTNFSIGNFGYVGLGESFSYSGMRNVDQQFFKYDPATDRWAEVSGIGKGIVRPLTGSNGVNGFTGSGSDEFGSPYKSLYIYTP